jgi:hypothetical protein
MTFRWIDGEELLLLKPIFDKFGWTPLDSVFAKALVAEENGHIIGFNVLQMVLRPEPIWIDPKHRGMERDLAMQLSTMMIDHLKDSGASYWEVIVGSPFVERLCIANGMEEIEKKMFAGGIPQ